MAGRIGPDDIEQGDSSNSTRNAGDELSPNQRDLLLASTGFAPLALVKGPPIGTAAAAELARAAASRPPNIVYFLVNNLGYGELGCYAGGILRWAETHRIDSFAAEGMKLLNFAPEAQCTPTRSALMTGRKAVRSSNHTAPDRRLRRALLHLSYSYARRPVDERCS
jgi:arylsulfatase